MAEHTVPTTEAHYEWHLREPEERLAAFRAMPRVEAGDFFLSLNVREHAELILMLSPSERKIWMRLLAPDDAADVIQLMPEEMRPEIVDLLDETTRRDVRALLAYAEDDAGGLSPRYARVRPDMTMDEALRYLRRQAAQVETIYYAYVLDSEQRLLGVISFREMFAASQTKLVSEVMRTDFVYASEETDQEQVALLFAEYGLLALPVVDAEMHMKGIVTVDDAVEVVEEEASEDIQKIGGMEALDAPYLDVGFWQMVKKRGGWLAILFVGEMLTATAMAFYEHEIARAVVLALFIPLIISSGGNSGSQATTLVIRAMAVGELRLRDWWRVVRRELRTGLVLGVLLGFIGMTRVLIWQAVAHVYGEHYVALALTVAFSLIGVVLFGTIAGSMLPFVLRRCGLDPASASAPFVATLVDVSGLVIYFSIASLILGGKLL